MDAPIDTAPTAARAARASARFGMTSVPGGLETATRTPSPLRLARPADLAVALVHRQARRAPVFHREQEPDVVARGVQELVLGARPEGRLPAGADQLSHSAYPAHRARRA